MQYIEDYGLFIKSRFESIGVFLGQVIENNNKKIITRMLSYPLPVQREIQNHRMTA
ncbi:hypothetical protein DAMNIGENAA_19130 [Desulforhabdus amnigena]|uniref:Uncharacterized protein n=1 Tax=Desulforhabdus amnigena TaxID=40218 RepID=A0A9W6D5E3_9BACT|nr:hypothetical protein DAMNIGENAA_19130 [Desulforhabdus amnigena]